MKDLTYQEIFEAIEKYGSITKAAEAFGIPRTTLSQRYHRLKNEKFAYKEIEKAEEFNTTSVRRFILTSAQNDTKIHEGFWNNLLAYANHINAEVFVSGFTYSTNPFDEDTDKRKAHFDPSLSNYLVHKRLHFGKHLAFCGEMNILPTAVQPLSGLEIYTEDRSGIFPHPKMHLRSIPTSQIDMTKFIMTTGAVTLPNYIKRKAGIKAEQHHIIGAVIVEILADGKFFFRHIEAERDGSFQDLDIRVQNGKVTKGHSILAFVPGDIHIGQEDKELIKATWFDPDCFIDRLRPTYQFLHDVSDFTPRNHHRINDPHFRYKMFKDGKELVEDEIDKVGKFLSDISKKVKHTVVVNSNHHNALLRWLKEADYKSDPVNAVYFLTLQLEQYRSIDRGEEDFDIFEWACYNTNYDLSKVKFLKEDESFILHNIEFGMHGHYGANGARGNPLAFARMGKRSVTGHTHSIIRIDGHMSTGMFGKLKQNYVHGLSSWSHSGVIVYDNGKRTHVTFHDDYSYCGEQWRKKNVDF